MGYLLISKAQRGLIPQIGSIITMGSFYGVSNVCRCVMIILIRMILHFHFFPTSPIVIGLLAFTAYTVHYSNNYIEQCRIIY